MPSVVAVLPRSKGDDSCHEDPPLPKSYRLVAAETLPSVDVRRTVRQALLDEKWSRRHAAFMRRHATLSVVCYFSGLLYRFYGMVVPSRYSLGWWLLLASLVQLPSVTAVTLSLRVDILRQLTKSFEFWFFSAVNVVWAVALVAGYGDARISVCLLNWLETENAKVTDANLQGLHYVVATASFAIVMLLSFLIGIVFNFTELKPVVVFTTPRGHAMLVRDVLLNVMGTILLLMARLVYRRRDAVRHTSATRAMLCVTCRCRLKFVATAKATASKRALQDKRPTTHQGKINLECVAIRELFPTSHTVLGRGSLPSFPRMLRWSWYAICVGAVSSLAVLCVATPNSAVASAPIATPFAAATVALTALAASPFVALHQRQLLRRLYGSFDFVFLLAQSSLTALCVSHLMDFNPLHCAVMICAWVWCYIVATYDALTPDARRLLHWTPRRAAGLALLVLAMTLIVALELAVFGVWSVSDRVLVDWRALGTRVRVTGIPFVFSRLAILLVWLCRLVWRLASCGDDELIMLLGAVQYEMPRAAPPPAAGAGANHHAPLSAITPVGATT